MKIRSLLTFVLGVFVASAFWAFSGGKKERPLEQAGAFPASVALDCLPPSAEEISKFQTILTTREAFHVGISSIGIGADAEAAHGLYRELGKGRLNAVCPPDHFYQELSRILAADPDAFRHRHVARTLNLLAKLPAKQITWMESVASAAFSELPMVDEFLTWKDIRPLAMATLATFGPMAKQFSQRAFDRASSVDAISTGAAQVAVATRHPRAIEMVTQLVRAELARYPEGEVIPFQRKLRLYELAYALGYAEPSGKDTFEVFAPMMDRKIQTPTHFGMIELEPREICAIMRRSSAGMQSRLLKHPICTDGKRSDFP